MSASYRETCGECSDTSANHDLLARLADVGQADMKRGNY
jgi:hypothetical protein